VADVRPGARRFRGRVEVRIVLEQLSPPTGTVLGPRGDQPDVVRVPFCGWLGLLAALERVLDPGSVDPSA
jgi:hypothetical protein